MAAAFRHAQDLAGEAQGGGAVGEPAVDQQIGDAALVLDPARQRDIGLRDAAEVEDQVGPGREHDLEVNPLKSKQLTNIRTTSKDEAIRLTPPRAMTLEQALAYIEDDELVEVTPKNVRLRKRLLDPNARKRESRMKEAG